MKERVRETFDEIRERIEAARNRRKAKRNEDVRNALEDAAEAGDGDYDAFMDALDDDPRVNVVREDERES